MGRVGRTRKVTGKSISFSLAPRRAGDPPVLVADSKRAVEVLGWRPSFADMPAIIETARHWHCKPRY